MPNKNYIKGIKYEREIVNEAKEKGLMAFRSAGSRSPVDIIILDKFNKVVYFIQAKNKKVKEDNLKEEFEFNDTGYRIIFEVRQRNEEY